MKFNIITLFPDFFSGFISCSLIHKAIQKKIIEITLVNLRDFAINKHGQVDDKVFGGGPGMLLQIEPIDKAINSIDSGGGFKMLCDPRGKILDSYFAQELAELEQREKMRRSVIASIDLKKGKVLTREDLDAKRPGTGIPPEKIDILVGKKVTKDIEKDAMILETDIE